MGHDLHDHPTIVLTFAGTPELEADTEAFARTRHCPEEQTIAKARSARCQEAFDLHLCPIGGFAPAGGSERFRWTVMIGNLVPRSRGLLRISGSDPEAPPLIDHGFLTDPAGDDVTVLSDGVRLVREVMRHGLEFRVGREPPASAGAQGGAALDAWIRASVAHYYHPVGTCKMGHDDDAGAVVDSSGRLRGLDDLWIADCSIIPAIPRANTALPAVVIGIKVAEAMTASRARRG